MIHTIIGFRVVNEAEDVFLEFPYFLYDPESVDNFICVSSAFSKPKLYIWTFLVQVLLKPSLKDFDLNLASMCDEHNCTVVNILWHCPSLRLKLKLTFSSPVALEFSKFADVLSATL